MPVTSLLYSLGLCTGPCFIPALGHFPLGIGELYMCMESRSHVRGCERSLTVCFFHCGVQQMLLISAWARRVEISSSERNVESMPKLGVLPATTGGGKDRLLFQGARNRPGFVFPLARYSKNWFKGGLFVF